MITVLLKWDLIALPAPLSQEKRMGLSKVAGNKMGSKPVTRRATSVSIFRVWTPGLVCLQSSCKVYKKPSEVDLLFTHKDSISV